MPLTQHELELQRAALRRIEQGVLPRMIIKSIWAGRGSGKPCSLCDQPIPRAEMEYELADTAGAAPDRIHRFHVRCHELWQLEVAGLIQRSTGRLDDQGGRSPGT